MLCRSKALLLVLVAVALAAVNTFAQSAPIYDRGATGLDQAMKRVGTTASVMMIGAHPDDENSALLTYLARGVGARTAYLSLTRGDGGQNIIGPELFESLGVIRTEELVQARVLDGAEQYFARAYDYGFSKTLAEARSKWPEEVIKCDVVRAIRQFRPMVVISVFSGTQADGHGHHQFSGYLSPIAVVAASDATQCPNDGLPWSVRKFYVGRGFTSQEPADLMIDTGEFDLSLGRSYFEVALHGRSQHRSQGEGRIEPKGEQFSALNSFPKGQFVGEKSVFDGLDTSLGALPVVLNEASAEFKASITRAADAYDVAVAAYRVSDRQQLIAGLAAVGAAAGSAEMAASVPHSKFFARSIRQRANAALLIAAGIQIDALTNVETANPGDNVSVSVKVFRPKAIDSAIEKTELVTPDGYSVTRVAAPETQQTGRSRAEIGSANDFYSVRVPMDAALSEPYWLSRPRRGGIFEWPDGDVRGLPFARPKMTAKVTLLVGGRRVEIEQPVEFRFADPTRGEIRREFSIVPKFDIEPVSRLVVKPASNSRIKHSLEFAVRSNATNSVLNAINADRDGSKTEVEFDMAIKFDRMGERRIFAIDVEMDGKPGRYSFDLYARSGDARFDREMVTIAYPHIQTRRFYRPATTVVKVIDMKAERRKIGYVMGPGDDVPTAIEQIGFDMKLLGETDLATGDLDRYDSIVVGIRAYETRSDLVAANSRLLDYVRRGGNLIVQYQRNAAFFQSMMPFPATVGPRVADETAPVTILEPEHEFFITPNQITDRDFDDWVQERNLYSLRTFDAGYIPLLAANDPGEQGNNGGLVNARVGKGNYTYCSYAFFRQLPAGVDGAYRIFANMLSRPRS